MPFKNQDQLVIILVGPATELSPPTRQHPWQLDLMLLDEWQYLVV